MEPCRGVDLQVGRVEHQCQPVVAADDHQQFGERLVAESGVRRGEGVIAQSVGGAQLGDDVERGAFGAAEAGGVEVPGVEDGVDLLLGQPSGAGEPTCWPSS